MWRESMYVLEVLHVCMFVWSSSQGEQEEESCRCSCFTYCDWRVVYISVSASFCLHAVQWIRV